MTNKYFLHEVRMGTETFKGIVINDTLDAALQGYHAFLGAYAYGNSDKTTFAQAMITDIGGNILKNESWVALSEQDPNED